jgi:hypothetical protein
MFNEKILYFQNQDEVAPAGNRRGAFFFGKMENNTQFNLEIRKEVLENEKTNKLLHFDFSTKWKFLAFLIAYSIMIRIISVFKVD